MSTASSDAADTPSDTAGNGNDGGNPWLVRLLLILSFGVAFGIEGMTLIRSFVLEGDGEAEEQVESTEPGDGERNAEPLRTGDDLLPTTAVSERVAQMRIRARTDAPWTFHLVVRVRNDTDSLYRLTVEELETDDGTEYEDFHSVDCPPGESADLVASWPIAADARPAFLEVEGELVYSSDSTRTAEREVRFGHVPVQMER